MFTVYNKEQEQAINYLIDNNIVKLCNIEFHNQNKFDKYEIYQVQLVHSKKFEIL